jgi:S-adenosylmethionine decarboxylase proenzyme
MIVGKHVVADVVLLDEWKSFAISATMINDPVEYLQRCLENANATILGVKSHHFPGGGVTAIFLLAESHLSIHTWPEHSGFCIDIFTCGTKVCPVAVIESILFDLKDLLKNKSITVLDRNIS